MTQSATRHLQALDAAHHLHPFTNTRALNARGARVITQAQGVYLTDSEGRQILDGMSGLWCVAVGHSRAEIVDAVADQMRKLSYYNTFFNTTHPGVVALSERLARITPPQFSYFHYTGSGSESNDTIIRLARYYWHLRGQLEKTIFISRRSAYHGSTVAAASLGGFEAMHAQGGLPIPGIHHAPAPYWWRDGVGEDLDAFGARIAHQTLAEIDAIGPNKIAAMIAEPIMGAGGVIVPPRSYWPILAAGLKARDILLASDEVICGFGRTGHWFGCEWAGMTPDFLTLAKALTSGHVPMGAVAVADSVADVLIDKGDEFVHGHTYSGHPAACAAALATLDILEREALVERVHDDIGPYLQQRWRALSAHPLVGEAVMEGLIGALQLTPDKVGHGRFPEAAEVGMTARDLSLETGLVMRAVGDRLIIAPPLTLCHEDADKLILMVEKVLDLSLKRARDMGLMRP